MKPYGPLMVEHRLIEKMLKLLETGKALSKDDIAKIVDFFRNYADRRHHGKEEDILFRRLAAKKIKIEQRNTMNMLIDEHEQARQIINELEMAGNEKETKKCLEKLIKLYPPHITTEDQHFFIPVMEYLSEEEQEEMIKEYAEIDKKIPDEKYRQMIKQMEEK